MKISENLNPFISVFLKHFQLSESQTKNDDIHMGLEVGDIKLNP